MAELNSLGAVMNDSPQAVIGIALVGDSGLKEYMQSCEKENVDRLHDRGP